MDWDLTGVSADVLAEVQSNLDEFWELPGSSNDFSLLGVIAHGDQSFRRERLEELVALADAQNLALHVTGTHEWFRENPDFCLRENFRAQWKDMDSDEKKEWHAQEKEKRDRFKNKNLKRLAGVHTSNYDTTKWEDKVEPPITEGLRAGVISYTSVNVPNRFFEEAFTTFTVTNTYNEANDRTYASIAETWTTTSKLDAWTGNAGTDDFLVDHDDDATTFFWSDRIAKADFYTDDELSNWCPRYSSKQDSFYAACEFSADGAVVLGGWGACEYVVWDSASATRRLAADETVTIECTADCLGCLVTACDASDNCENTDVSGTDAVIDTAGYEAIYVTYSSLCGEEAPPEDKPTERTKVFDRTWSGAAQLMTSLVALAAFAATI